jgi:hypothetical protein
LTGFVSGAQSEWIRSAVTLNSTMHHSWSGHLLCRSLERKTACCFLRAATASSNMTDQQWNPDTTDRGWHWLRRRDCLEWRLTFRDRPEVGWRVSDVIGRTVAMSSGKVGRLFTYHGPVRRPDEP